MIGCTETDQLLGAGVLLAPRQEQATKGR